MASIRLLPFSLRPRSRSGRWHIGVVALLAVLCGCAAPPGVPVAIATIPAGAARIWIYRDYEPYETLARPYVRMNGGIVGVSVPGASFYRDVSPGNYFVAVDSAGQDVNQFVKVAVAAGQTAFIKVESSNSWESDLNYRVDTFYTRLIPREIAESEVAHSRVYDGGG